MINIDEMGARIIWSFGDGSFYITESTLFGVIIAVILAILGIWLGSNLKEVPKGKQVFVEFVVDWVYKFTEEQMGKRFISFAPYVGTLFAFIFCASSLGLLGIRPITADLNVTAALAILTFIMINANSIRANGVGGRLKEMAEPYAFMFPFKLMEQITLPVSLALRMFGNILGGYIIVELWLHLMTFLSNKITTIPFLRAITVLPLNAFFDVVEPVLQTFIFTILTVINIRLAMATMGDND